MVPTLAVGQRVLVTGIDGATAVVVPVERSTPQ
jgi:membrane protein implicated in regulation of membrane protease activity